MSEPENKSEDLDFISIGKATKEAMELLRMQLTKPTVKVAIKSGKIPFKRKSEGKYARYYVRTKDLVSYYNAISAAKKAK